MKKWICCFSFFLFYTSCFLFGHYGLGQLLFEGKSGMIETEKEEEVTYPGENWEKRGIWEYSSYFVLLCYFHEKKKKMFLLWCAWCIYGLLMGIYSEGLIYSYGRKTGVYLYLMPFLVGGVLSLVTGFLLYWWKDVRVYRYYGRKNGKRLFEFVRGRVLMYGRIAIFLFVCWFLEQEILRRIQWKWLIQFLKK